MLRAAVICVWVLMVSLVTTGSVHAREIPVVSHMECSGFVHSDLERDHKDDHDAYNEAAIEHHSCHTASSFVVVMGYSPLGFIAFPKTYPPTLQASLTPKELGPGLRPPRA